MSIEIPPVNAKDPSWTRMVVTEADVFHSVVSATGDEGKQVAALNDKAAAMGLAVRYKGADRPVTD